ncbi:MAG: hypothetical protein R3A44_29395 [Caldilineaceae bacterium]
MGSKIIISHNYYVFTMNVFYLISLLHKTFQLNIWDLNYIYSNPHSIRRYQAIGSAFPIKQGIIPRIGSFFYHMLLGIYHLATVRNRSITPGGVFLFAITKNQTDSLRPLLGQLEKSYLIKDRHNVHEDIAFPAFWAYIISVLYLPVLCYQFWRKRNALDIYAICRYRLDGYWLAYGYYLWARLWLRRKRPLAVIFSNDHTMECRAMNQAAREEGIITIYIQHASVSEEFPVLAFDYAFLDGIDALDIYERIGSSSTIVYLVGICKQDHYYHRINKNQVAQSICVCTNILDPIAQVNAMCKQLHQKFPQAVLHLRPHPADKRLDEWQQIAEHNTMSLSDSRRENALECLSRVDVVIAGNSSIHVDAALLNVYPIFYNFSQNSEHQTYTFLQRKLCDSAETLDELMVLLENIFKYKPEIRNRAKPYCATINTHYDGRSTELIGSLARTVLSGGKMPINGWQKLDKYTLNAYQLSC